MKKWFVTLVLATMVLALAACQAKDKPKEDAAEDKLEKVTMVLDWTPNTNHTGLYVAEAQGFFKDQGLDVEIIQPGDAGADQLVASGKADFGISYQEAITLARTQGVPLVSVAAIIQHNTSGFASPKAKEIATPKDFEGKTYGGWGSPIEKAVIETIMKADGGDVAKMDIINAGDADFFTMTEKDIDFAWIYYGWTGVEAELRGKDINMVYLTDYSDKLDYYTPVLSTSEKMMDEKSDIVKKMVAAVAKGYEYAIENPEDAANILLVAAPDLSQDLVINSQKWLADKYQDDAEQWGVQKLDVWKNYADWMTENGVLEGDFDPEQAFTNEFLPKK
ncbi:Putative thiamine biosynthesis protein [Metalysinibacillus saudimassiliensis]|uniref:Putative thiamine biosynthesis protein n=1 Tax=Metalysinibacillus saudimassiliensis TaxID=1461583 RepID=A0A078M5W4_9BACL|nr:Putative thiamine biosynthesis protein [Metalysinibacillus saudimassiliensis]